MSKYSPNWNTGRVATRGDLWYDRGSALGDKLADGVFKGIGLARQKQLDEIEQRRYVDQQERIARIERRQMDKDAADAARVAASDARQAALDAATGLVRFNPASDPRANERIPDPVSAEYRPRYEPLAGDYFRDYTRTPEYADREQEARVGELAGQLGVPGAYAPFGLDAVQNYVEQTRDNQLQLERDKVRHQQTLAEIGARGQYSGGTGGTTPRPTRQAPMGVITSVQQNDTLLGQMDSVLSILEGGKQVTGGVGGFLPDIVRSAGTSGGEPNAFGRALGAVGVSRDVFTAEGSQAWSQIADLMSKQLLDRSGAAVTVSEFSRLKPYLPNRQYPPEENIRRIKEMMRVIAEETDFLKYQYAQDPSVFPIISPNLDNVRTRLSGPRKQSAGTTQNGMATPDPTGGFLNRFTVTPRR